MKTAPLPPVRVDPAGRQEVEAALREGERLSAFVEAAALQTARRRKAQEEILARGRASLADAQRTGAVHSVEEELDRMRARLDKRMQAHCRQTPLAVKA